MLDHIVSYRTNKVYATIEYEKHCDIKHFFQGTILEFAFPETLHNLISEYDEILSEMALSLLDEVEEKIQAYDLRLEKANERIFCVVIKDKREISFFIKYPTSHGFRDVY